MAPRDPTTAGDQLHGTGLGAPHGDRTPEQATALDQADGKKQRGKGKLGSLENPESYENVPGHVIPILEREFDDFDNEAEKFLGGETPEDQFIGFRLKQGVYGQRQPDVQMIRVKLPFGGVTPEQMEAFASVVERYAPLGKGHITTRQNIQIHHVPLPDAAEAIRELSDAGLSSREGCGNTVRNVTGDPWAGVAEDETFDPTPYAGAYVRYFVRHPTTQLMPRKIKTAFTGSDEDRAITGIHDIGFIARERDGVKGFELRVGGGTSIMPRIAPTLSEFVDRRRRRVPQVHRGGAADLRPPGVAAGQPRPRPDQGPRRQGRDRRFPRDGRRGAGGRLGRRARFRRRAAALRRRRGGQRPGVANRLRLPQRRPLRVRRASWQPTCRPQRQHGFSTVEVKVTRGDLSPAQFRGLAAIMREFTGGYARSTVQQNLVLRWVRDESLYDVWQRLDELDLGDVGPRQVTDVVSCPGTDSCKLGITSSMGLNRAIQERLEAMQITDPLTKQIHIKMSGCPNGCSQHHIGTIGFYGASLKIGDRQLPAYIPHIGGGYEGGEVVYGHAAEVSAARQARPRGGRALAAALRGRAHRRRALQRLRRAGRDGAASKPRSRT